MTLPNERLRAVKNVREFLRRLISPYGENSIKKIPKDVRRQAYYLLKHFPADYEVLNEHIYDEETSKNKTKKQTNREE